MIEKTKRTSLILAIIKFALFLIILCFLIPLVKEFIKQLRAEKILKDLYLAIFSCFLFYTFLVDLTPLYKNIQRFFFHNSFLALFIPSLFILCGLAFFIIPKLFNLYFRKDIFLFLGGFLFSVHLIFISQQIKEKTFAGFINYLFMLSILFILTLFLLGLYLNIAFSLDLKKIFIEGIQGGALSIKNLFT